MLKESETMRLFIDSNILISGIVFAGYEHHLFKRGARREIEIIVSEDVIDESLAVLNRKFPAKAYLLREFLRLSEAKIIRRKEYAKLIERQIVRDTNDKHILAAAIASGCYAIVTGDKDLLVLKRDKRVKIISTKEALEV